MTSRIQRCNHGLMGVETQLYAGKGKVKAKKSRLSGSLGYDAFELRVSYGVMPVGLSSFASPYSAELPFSKGFITIFYTDNENFYINTALVSFNFRLTWKWRLKPTALCSAAALLCCSKPSGATALLMKSQLIKGNRQGVSRASVTSSESPARLWCACHTQFVPPCHSVVGERRLRVCLQSCSRTSWKASGF